MKAKNLESKEILSDEMLSVIDRIIKLHPEAVFGGSLALNAVGLITRKIKDIDVFFPEDALISKELFSGEPATYPSEHVEIINGTFVSHSGFDIDDVSVCFFKVDSELLLSSPIEFSGRKVNIQNVNYAILAKLAYAAKGYDKHKKDLKNIFEKLFEVF